MVDNAVFNARAAGNRPDFSGLETFLSEWPADQRAAALRRWIETDIYNRKAAGESPTASDYAALVSDEAQLREIEAAVLAPPAHTSTCVTTCTRQGDAPARGQPPGPEVPTQLGRYRAERLVGAGGFGMVIAARDLELDRVVAIKVPFHVPSDDDWEQHLAEARAAARLAHRGIVAVYDCGRLPDGRFFIVSEFVAGGTLAAELAAAHDQGRRLPVRRTVELMIELADAMHHAHQQGLFHRDLKPQNILIDSAGRARITDFGLMIDEARQHEVAGEVAGSPPYMSPEQVRGQPHFLDGRSDIWSLGVIFYELLAGRRPFRGPSQPALFEEIQHRDPRPLRQIDDRIPHELEAICLTCLQREASERYASAADLASELRAWLHGQGDPQATPSEFRRPARGMRAWPGRAMLAAALAAIGLAGGMLWIAVGGRDRATIQGQQTLPPVGAAQAGPARATSASAAFLGPDTAPRGIWLPLLEHQPKVLHWPLVPRNSDLTYREARRELSVSTDRLAMLEFGRTAARDFRLRWRLHQPTWTGGIGLFWGYQDVADGRDSQYQVIFIKPYRETRNAAAMQLAWGSVACNRDGWKLRENTLQGFETARPKPGDAELEIRIQDGLLHSVRWDGKDLGPIANRDPLVQPQPADSQGAFGLSLERSSVLVRDAAILFPR